MAYSDIPKKEETDELLLKSIIGEYTKILYNFVSRFGFSNEETEDILQNIFIKTWKNSDDFNETKSSRKTWIFMIAKNVIYDTLRKKKKTKIVNSLDDTESNYDEEDLADISSDIEILLERARTKEILLEAINTLNENEKTIVLLHNEESLTFNELSLIFNSPQNTVKSTYRRSLLKLRKFLGNVHQNTK